ncbi:short-chain dehydrogenase/reductase family [Colletotrichum tofieldiae]|uniref:Short-chain dehydrogenase/reductase family n=1 Tax=Colletotrichum tofieldiae TaxID=708197 RepID=A0A166YSX4_9PEZI|nr:short-chain dehydrogenase/reductase family [Colletotrichum tofieldiae]GKT62854.1 short-chain dehydrogenase/reductase family [Colletotrichum tofieldiae]GKT69105.1 short-chain dehydrogenase/reductase family [Colletotrichum tofieldiae]GKT96603.1 short-chain dehydrogenase/reductase family [Colletotrichum tofieldiae]
MSFLYSQLIKSLPYPSGSYAGKTIVVTGSNVGLGKEAARHFARLGASKLILAVRSLDKGRVAKEDIEATTNCAKDVIEVWELDMSKYASVQKFASRLSTGLERVDIFVANAGVAHSQFRQMEEDEGTITVNVVSTFLLMALVLPKMKETAAKFNTRPTFTITSSEVHAWTTFEERNAPDGEIYNTINEKASRSSDDVGKLYPLSKLLEVLGVRTFAELHPASEYPVTVNNVNPGFCHSELARDIDSWRMWLMKLFLARTTEYGSRNLVYAGSAGAESHGHYVSDCAVAEPSPFVRSKEGKEAQDRAWSELMQKLEAIQPGVTSKL